MEGQYYVFSVGECAGHLFIKMLLAWQIIFAIAWSLICLRQLVLYETDSFATDGFHTDEQTPLTLSYGIAKFCCQK
jgi:hypothetical protein